MRIQEQPDLALVALHRDEHPTAERVEDLLDVLESNPLDPRARAHELRHGIGPLASAAWDFRVRAISEDVYVFWTLVDDEATVAHLGPHTPGR